MRLKQGLELQDVANEYIIIPGGVENVDFSSIISLSESAAYLWKEICNTDTREIDPSSLVAKLVDRYGIDTTTAEHDIEELIEQWQKIGLTL